MFQPVPGRNIGGCLAGVREREGVVNGHARTGWGMVEVSVAARGSRLARARVREAKSDSETE